MRLEDIPNKKGPRYPGKLYVSISRDAENKLKELDRRGKSIPDLIREMLDEKLAAIKFEEPEAI